ncbi:MAG: aspartate aminotransferase family protein [Ruminococcaceae bacterium]|nr:aspartate aminotransferase family protein [Oscillospiraceae bacterium]
MNTTKNLDKEYIAASYGRFDVLFEKGEGSLLFDENGKRYIDLGSGIAVNTFGLCDKVWQSAVSEQASKLQHVSNLYYTSPMAQLAQMLCEKTGMKKVFFSNSGAEANECAIKCARKYSFDKYGEGRNVIITLKQSFHGRTITTLSATGQDTFHTTFGPFTDGFRYAEPNDIEDMKALVDDKVCGIMIELIQGEGGVNVLKPDYVKQLEALCREKDIMLIIDEVQTGNGRTGALYCYMNYGISPDIVSTAKGLAGGLPMGATMMGEKTKDTITAGSHGSTFGGNPVCAAGACSIISRIDDKLMADVKRKSEYIINALSGAKGVKSITGLGFMLGVETEKPAKDVVVKCIERGVVPLTAKNKVRLLPALNIPDELLTEAITVLKQVIEE